MSDLLTPVQRALLIAVGKSDLARQVYFTGGTLLAAHYLEHRRSLDLDFFSDELPDDLIVAAAVKKIGVAAGARETRFVRFPNRWQYFLTVGREEIKFEIVYFPFPAIGKRIKLDEFGLIADSLRDIAVNKVHASYEREAPRDAFDLFVIMKKQGWMLAALLKDVERKFGVSIDPVHLAARLVACVERLDEVRPLFIGAPPSAKEMIAFFQTPAVGHLDRKVGRR